MAKTKESNAYFRHDEATPQSTRWAKRLSIIAAAIFLASGLYLLVLTQIPRVANLPGGSSIDLNTNDDENDQRNRIQIKKLNLEVPFFTGGAEQLEKGAWWRFPERGDPLKGGNFILSAHRFSLGLTPEGTRARSPFYRLGELAEGDSLRIYYEKKWYDYKVTRNYSVKPDAIEIEEETEKPKLTLYTCTLGGSADGRTVIDAEPQFEIEDDTPSNSPLL